MLVLEVDGDLGDGQDEEGGDVGGHQLVHRVPFQPLLKDENIIKVKIPPYHDHCLVCLLTDVTKCAADNIENQELLITAV